MRPRPGTTGMTRRTRQRRRSPQLPRSPERRSGKLVTAQDVRDAAERLRGVAVRTPLRYVEPLDAYLKLENLQPIGAFKIRGAYNAISRLPPAARRAGVITYSSGNHGQAVAYAAQLLGIRAVVVMPETAPAVKVAGVQKWGGEVVFAGRTSQDRQVKAEELSAREGLAVVPPFDHPDIVAGQATVGLEIAADLPDVGTVVVPVGGGGHDGGAPVRGGPAGAADGARRERRQRRSLASRGLSRCPTVPRPRSSSPTTTSRWSARSCGSSRRTATRSSSRPVARGSWGSSRRNAPTCCCSTS